MIIIKNQNIENVIDCKLSQGINKEHTVEFNCVFSTKNSNLVKVGEILTLDGQFYDIKEVDFYRGSGIICEAYGEHFSYRLNNYLAGECSLNCDVKSAVEILLDRTMFVAGAIEFSNYINYRAYPNSTKRTCLLDLAALCGAEVEFDNTTVHFRKRLGNISGKTLSSGKDLISIRKKESDKGEAYEVEFAELSALGAQGENLELGDTVTLIDEELGINVSSRVVSYEFNPLKKQISKVELNTRFSTLSDKFLGIRKETKEMIDEALENFEIEELGTEIIETVVTNNLITNNLYAKRGRIAELTVDSLLTGDFLKGEQQIFYIEIKEQYCRYMQAQRTDEMVQYKSYDNELLYWKDEIKQSMTTEETEFPVMVHVYEAIPVMEMSFEEVEDEIGTIRTPVIGLGRGDGLTPLSSKGRIYKSRTGLVVEYFKSNTEQRLAIELMDDGIRFDGYPNIITGESDPDSDTGKDGDIYIKF